jgi:lipoprotein-anchoring transpeptidase ErfK/SrfK
MTSISGKMPDYYAILWRALRKGDFQNVRWRESFFEQIRQTLRDQLRNRQSPMSPAEISYHTDALESAIETIRGELAEGAGAQAVTPRTRPNVERAGDTAEIGDMRSAAEPPRSFVSLISIALVIVAVAAAAGGYAYFASQHDIAPPPKVAAQTTPPPQPKVATPSNPPPAAATTVPPAANPPPPPPAANKAEATKQAVAPSLKRPKTLHQAALPDGDLPPGVDGRLTDDVAFFLWRQPVFYRSTYPVGSVIVDKQQHFLYFIQSPQVAQRYGIGVGKSCAGVAGLHKLADKKEWPEWQAPADMVERKLARSGVMKGGPGNPLGARILLLDDGGLSLHGTNAPATIGSSIDFGCIRLANDDAVDLSNRVAIGARVIFSD